MDSSGEEPKEKDYSAADGGDKWCGATRVAQCGVLLSLSVSQLVEATYFENI